MRARTQCYRPHAFTRHPQPGFSLFEVLVVMAVIALLTGIITVNFNRIIPALQDKPLDRVLTETLQDARILAATSGNTVHLSFNADAQAFILTEKTRSQTQGSQDDDQGLDTSAQPLQVGFSGSRSTQILFYPRLSPSTRMSARAQEFSRDPVPYLVFHPSGVSTPAKVVIQRPGGDDEEIILDAFSSGPLDTSSF